MTDEAIDKDVMMIEQLKKNSEKSKEKNDVRNGEIPSKQSPFPPIIREQGK